MKSSEKNPQQNASLTTLMNDVLNANVSVDLLELETRMNSLVEFCRRARDSKDLAAIKLTLEQSVEIIEKQLSSKQATAQVYQRKRVIQCFCCCSVLIEPEYRCVPPKSLFESSDVSEKLVGRAIKVVNTVIKHQKKENNLENRMTSFVVLTQWILACAITFPEAAEMLPKLLDTTSFVSLGLELLKTEQDQSRIIAMKCFFYLVKYSPLKKEIVDTMKSTKLGKLTITSKLPKIFCNLNASNSNLKEGKKKKSGLTSSSLVNPTPFELVIEYAKSANVFSLVSQNLVSEIESSQLANEQSLLFLTAVLALMNRKIYNVLKRHNATYDTTFQDDLAIKEDDLEAFFYLQLPSSGFVIYLFSQDFVTNTLQDVRQWLISASRKEVHISPFVPSLAAGLVIACPRLGEILNSRELFESFVGQMTTGFLEFLRAIETSRAFKYTIPDLALFGFRSRIRMVFKACLSIDLPSTSSGIQAETLENSLFPCLIILCHSLAGKRDLEPAPRLLRLLAQCYSDAGCDLMAVLESKETLSHFSDYIMNSYDVLGTEDDAKRLPVVGSELRRAIFVAYNLLHQCSDFRFFNSDCKLVSALFKMFNIEKIQAQIDPFLQQSAHLEEEIEAMKNIKEINSLQSERRAPEKVLDWEKQIKLELKASKKKNKGSAPRVSKNDNSVDLIAEKKKELTSVRIEIHNLLEPHLCTLEAVAISLRNMNFPISQSTSGVVRFMLADKSLGFLLEFSYLFEDHSLIVTILVEMLAHHLPDQLTTGKYQQHSLANGVFQALKLYHEASTADSSFKGLFERLQANRR